MTHTSKTAVFFGSGPVAAASLEKLLTHTDIEAVVTKPRPAHHRGSVPVLEVAEKHALRTITAHDKASLTEALGSETIHSNYAILIDFGIIVTQEVIDIFPLGIINSHFSLLPHLRGADPISFSILTGDAKTGVSLMMVDDGLDTGKLLTYRTLPIEPTDTTPSLTAKLIDLSDQLIQEYVPRYLAGEIAPKNQPHPDRATYSRKLTKDDGTLYWQKPADTLSREIRAFYDWPKSKGRIGGIEAIIREAHATSDVIGKPGSHKIVGNTLLVQTGEGCLSIDRIQPLGKKEMPIQAFLAGYKDKL